MNFDFSEEQKLLKDQARRLLAARCTPATVRAALERNSYDEPLWRAVAELGWLALAIPEALGGAGLGRIELCALAEELGRACAPLPFASTVYAAAEALQLAGSKEQQERWLPAFAAGERIGALAIAEGPGPTLDAAALDNLQTRVIAGKLSGVKMPVTDGDSAHVAIVLARDGEGCSLFLVDLTQPGVERRTLSSVDPSRGIAQLRFSSADAERLGAPGEGLMLVRRVLDGMAVLIAFEQLGGAARCLEMAREYALQRYAFGRTIASYQAIKHKLAQMYINNELARSNAYYGAWALDSAPQELPLAAAAARVAASTAYWFAAKENIQTHGGMGYTWEADCHLYYRRARQLQLVVGAPRVWKEQLTAALERSAANASM
ncbi:MAG: acyl-CoA/acyl-ACP dehydrogenase [Gammaproteobacteria bacterium]|nr:acyl-CoA/acyl-ACP dehydrogenase [Gammaproteobacteria bacterium]